MKNIVSTKATKFTLIAQALWLMSKIRLFVQNAKHGFKVLASGFAEWQCLKVCEIAG